MLLILVVAFMMEVSCSFMDCSVRTWLYFVSYLGAQFFLVSEFLLSLLLALLVLDMLSGCFLCCCVCVEEIFFS